MTQPETLSQKRKHKERWVKCSKSMFGVGMVEVGWNLCVRLKLEVPIQQPWQHLSMCLAFRGRWGKSCESSVGLQVTFTARDGLRSLGRAIEEKQNSTCKYREEPAKALRRTRSQKKGTLQ